MLFKKSLLQLKSKIASKHCLKKDFKLEKTKRIFFILKASNKFEDPKSILFFPLQQKSEVQKFSIGGKKKSLECFVLGFRNISPNDILPTSTFSRRVFNSLYPIELVKYIYSYTIWCLIEHIYIHIPAGQPSVSVNWLSAKWNSTKWRGAHPRSSLSAVL